MSTNAEWKEKLKALRKALKTLQELEEEWDKAEEDYWVLLNLASEAVSVHFEDAEQLEDWLRSKPKPWPQS